MQRGFLLIPVQHLTDEPVHLALACAATKIGLDDFIGDVVVDATVRKVDRRILLQCRFTGRADMLCDRCAEPFTGQYTGEYEQWYVIDAHPESVDEEETYAINPEQTNVVIDNDVRENMLISLPMKRLCREDCKGLCPTCGRNRNVEECSCEDGEENPMWAELKNMKRNI